MENSRLRTTVSVSRNTKSRLDKCKAYGQCYDGFLTQIIELWEKTHNGYEIKRGFINQVSDKRAITGNRLRKLNNR
jgi:hypothetical protein